MSEQEMIELLNRKQVAGFRDLFNRFYRYLVVYALKWVERQEVAEDIVQEVFIRIWEKDTVYSSYYGLKDFLYNSVKNAALDYLKHKAVEGKYIKYALIHIEEDDNRELEIMKQEVYRRLYLVVEELPKRCREVFRLYLQGKTNAEIAALLQISELTIKAQKKNARQYIAKRLGGMYVIFVLWGII